MGDHLSSGAAEQGITLSLLNMCKKIFIGNTGDTFFGTNLWTNNPELFDAFKPWEHKNWKFLFGMPRFLSQDVLSARDTIIAHYEKYFETLLEERNGTNYYVKGAEKMLREIDCSGKDIASMFMLHFWA